MSVINRLLSCSKAQAGLKHYVLPNNRKAWNNIAMSELLYVKRYIQVSGMKMSSYITDEAYINGKWIKTAKTFEVKNPFTDEVIGRAADCDDKNALSAIAAAETAFVGWKNESVKYRSDIMKKWYELIMSERKKLSELITLENGKPIMQADWEALYAAGYVEWYAEECRRTHGVSIPAPVTSKRMVTIKQPIGVVSMITPWNFPAAMITRKACAAIASGCSVILKPSEETPYSALALVRLAEEAGLPPGVLNIVPASRSNVRSIGQLLCTHPSITAVSFTGSTATAKILLQHAASTVKKVSLENGGNAAFTVFDSADIAKAVQGAITSKFRNTGQSCLCANRILVQSGVYDEFIAKFSEAIEKQLKVGSPMDPDTNLGPLINEAAFCKVDNQVKNAVSLGAKVVIGGNRHNVGKNGYEPTILRDVTTEMDCCKYETFGPVAPVVKFTTEEEAINIANDTRSGLAGYVFSKDVAQCWRVSEKLEVGAVGINEGLISHPEGPLGGFKESGLGREGSIYGMDEFMEVKFLCWGV